MSVLRPGGEWHPQQPYQPEDDPLVAICASLNLAVMTGLATGDPGAGATVLAAALSLFAAYREYRGK
ncbi:hypothetical protein AB0H71_33660 [Nocardia sp. NPDC050697]|uniref:hypothetical protein n=1 Tax=Nocardia sp. NPDC050697 TaxID=3155158 RepID=UPI003406A41F